MYEYAICVGIGVVAGLLAGLCGVGGGVFMVPAFVLFLSMKQKEAVATSLAVVIGTALMGTLKNSGNQLVNWRVVIITSLASLLVVWFAADGLKKMSNLTLTRIFAVSIVAIGLWMLGRSFSKG
ncbi:MAG: sulfite exporter TauE/SafE family protein [Kiritimatiellia bacterium]